MKEPGELYRIAQLRADRNRDISLLAEQARAAVLDYIKYDLLEALLLHIYGVDKEASIKYVGNWQTSIRNTDGEFCRTLCIRHAGTIDDKRHEELMVHIPISDTEHELKLKLGDEEFARYLEEKDLPEAYVIHVICDATGNIEQQFIRRVTKTGSTDYPTVDSDTIESLVQSVEDFIIHKGFYNGNTPDKRLIDDPDADYRYNTDLLVKLRNYGWQSIS